MSARGIMAIAVLAMFQLGIIGGILLSKGKTSQRQQRAPVTRQAGEGGVTAVQQQKAQPPPTRAAERPTASVKSSKKQTEARQRKLRHVAVEQVSAPARTERVKLAAAALPVVHSAETDLSVRAYAAAMRSLVDQRKEYPAIARTRKIEGRCVIIGILKRDGSLKHAEVVKTSGSHILDDAALRSVRGVGKFPEVPEEVKGEEVSFEIPVVFRAGAAH